MSAELEHQECREALAAYALGALAADEAERVERHLLDCQECQAQLEWLRPAVDALPASVPQVEPPTELKAQVMKVVESEAEALRAAGAKADHPGSTSPAPRPARWNAWMIGLGLGAFALAAVLIVLAVTSGGPATRTIDAQITDPSLTGRVRAVLHVNDTRAQLSVEGLPAPARDHVDQLWVQSSPAAAPRSAGIFVLRSGAVSLSRPVRPGALVLVTVEPGRGSPGPTTRPLLVVRV